METSETLLDPPPTRVNNYGYFCFALLITLTENNNYTKKQETCTIQGASYKFVLQQFSRSCMCYEAKKVNIKRSYDDQVC